MSEQIKVGDLVMVVKPSPCCGHAMALGRVFKVAELEHDDGWCTHCNETFEPHPIARCEVGKPYFISRLKKIPPLSDPETIERTEELSV